MKKFSNDDFTIWRDAVAGELGVSADCIWTAYLENVEIAIKAARNIIEQIKGKSVVTSDHGQLFGERIFPIPIREWGHPDGIYHENVTAVPWLESISETRRNVIEEPPQESQETTESEIVENKLRYLGYIN
jgi:hypothetical protein